MRGDRMGYRIMYSKTLKKRFLKFRLPILVAVCVLCFVTLVSARWPEGATVIRTIFSFNNTSMTVSVLDRFTSDVMNSESLFASISNWIKGLLYDR